MTNAREPRSSITDKTWLSLSVVLGLLVGTVSVSMWIVSGLSALGHRMDLSDAADEARWERVQTQMQSLAGSVEKLANGGVSRDELSMWIELNRAQGTKMAEWPKRPR